MKESFDVVATWAAVTERELGAEAFQRDVAFLERILPLMEAFRRQGKYAHDPAALAAAVRPDVTVERIGDLLGYHLPDILEETT